MKINNHFEQLLIATLFCLTLGCSNKERESSASDYDFPSPIDTQSREISIQAKKTYHIEETGVFADNQFDGARLNDFKMVNDSLYEATISPENSPINDSPWYAFKLWSEEPKNVYVQLKYTISKHRYHPKLSSDGNSWTKMDTTLFAYNVDSTAVTLSLEVNSDTLWIAAQEVVDSKRVNRWCQQIAKNPAVDFLTIGQSEKGRDMYFLDIGKSEVEKDVIVILSRQHPPEVTGFFAMQAFVSGMLESESSSAFLENYRVLVYPLLNPDGVDMGHWRHNTGGVDLNRDWAYYRQPETRLVADHIVKTVNENGGKVMLGLDFHSTYHDVYYTQDKEQMKTPTTPWFRERWFANLEKEINGYKVNEKPSVLKTPVTKGWFYTQFGAEGMTYEIGDDTPRDSIQLIGRITSEEMMKILLEGK